MIGFCTQVDCVSSIIEITNIINTTRISVIFIIFVFLTGFIFIVQNLLIFYFNFEIIKSKIVSFYGKCYQVVWVSTHPFVKFFALTKKIKISYDYIFFLKRIYYILFWGGISVFIILFFKFKNFDNNEIKKLFRSQFTYKNWIF